MESSQRSRHSSSRPSSSRRNVSCVPTLRTCEIYGPVEDWDQVGEGTFGEVFKARDSQTDDMVALKKIRMRNEREGFPITAIREIKLLRDLHHENVIDLREVVSSKEEDKGRKGDVYIVFEFMDHDLMGLMDTAQLSSVQSNTPTGFPLPMIKCFAKQLLSGLHYCHKRNIMHRDIKGANLLITNSGVLKLGDFGLSRTFAANDPSYKYTNRVVTLWYRAPELLLGAVTCHTGLTSDDTSLSRRSMALRLITGVLGALWRSCSWATKHSSPARTRRTRWTRWSAAGEQDIQYDCAGILHLWLSHRAALAGGHEPAVLQAAQPRDRVPRPPAPHPAQV
eukprot:TRINITY_DN847_c0_g1_i11.p1 TRINITY_DN847_c0_g1~~TRINITY_DN847_c0_g1_i11.p1  ORF type:complete len:337 (-),score=32.33 TRINITY_DN847_c0_g1_i11:721-1731(-)